MGKIRTDRQIVFDKTLIKFQKDHPEINANATSRMLWYDYIKKQFPEEWILLQKFIPCSSKDFGGLNQIYPVYKSTPTFGETGFFIANKLIPDFSKIVPLDLPESFRKNCIDYMIKCWDSHLPFADLICIEDYKNGTFTDFTKYSQPENFTQIEGGFRFLNSKHIYTFKDSPETEARKKTEFEAGEIERSNLRTQEYNEELRVRQLAQQILREESEEKARKRIKEEKEELEKLKSSEINPPASASPTEAPSK